MTIVDGYYDCATEQPNQDCYIFCNGSDACETGAKIFECPSNYDCIINITEHVSTHGLRGGIVNAQNSNNLYIYCNGPSNTNLAGNTINCPIGGDCYIYPQYGNLNFIQADIDATQSNYLYIEAPLQVLYIKQKFDVQVKKYQEIKIIVLLKSMGIIVLTVLIRH